MLGVGPSCLRRWFPPSRKATEDAVGETSVTFIIQNNFKREFWSGWNLLSEQVVRHPYRGEPRTFHEGVWFRGEPARRADSTYHSFRYSTAVKTSEALVPPKP
jgi:hypothetical protein